MGLVLSFLSTGLVLLSIGLADLSLAELLFSTGLLPALSLFPSSCDCCCCESPPSCPGLPPLFAALLLLVLPPLLFPAPLLLFNTTGKAPRTSLSSPRSVAHSPLARSSSPSSRAPVAAFSSTITRNFAWKPRGQCTLDDGRKWERGEGECWLKGENVNSPVMSSSRSILLSPGKNYSFYCAGCEGCEICLSWRMYREWILFVIRDFVDICTSNWCKEYCIYLMWWWYDENWTWNWNISENKKFKCIVEIQYIIGENNYFYINN